jgi:hypothetical protein
LSHLVLKSVERLDTGSIVRHGCTSFACVLSSHERSGRCSPFVPSACLSRPVQPSVSVCAIPDLGWPGGSTRGH